MTCKEDRIGKIKLLFYCFFEFGPDDLTWPNFVPSMKFRVRTSERTLREWSPPWLRSYGPGSLSKEIELKST